METPTRLCGQKDAKGCVWNKERFYVALVKLRYPGLRSAVGKLMRNGLVEGSLAWKENTEGKVWSGEELSGSNFKFKLNCLLSDCS